MRKRCILVVIMLSLIFVSIFSISINAVEDVENSEKQLLINTLDEKLAGLPNSELSENVLASPEIIGDQSLSGKNITIPEGIYDGNIYLMGENVTFINASIKGNVYILAKNIQFNTTSISGSLYAMSGNMEASNETSIVDAYIMAQVLTMDDTFTSNRSFKAMGTDVHLAGNYIYDVDLLVDDSNIDIMSMNAENIIDSITNVNEIKANLVLGDNLVIGRNFNYSAKEEAIIPTTASINATNYSKIGDTGLEEIQKENKAWAILIQVVIKMVNAAFIAIVLGWTCKRYRRLNQYHSGIGLFFKSLLKGTLGAFIFITVAIGLICTVGFAGIGLVGTGYFLYGAFFSLAFAANMIAINILGTREESSEGIGYKVAMLGVTLIVALVIWTLSKIPVAGGYVSLIFGIMGIGGAMDLLFGNAKKVEEKYQKKMSKKYYNAKINPSNQAPTEEPKLDESEPFNNTSVMIDVDENKPDENNETTNKDEENKTEAKDDSEEVKTDDIKKDE